MNLDVSFLGTQLETPTKGLILCDPPAFCKPEPFMMSQVGHRKIKAPHIYRHFWKCRPKISACRWSLCHTPNFWNHPSYFNKHSLPFYQSYKRFSTMLDKSHWAQKRQMDFYVTRTVIESFLPILQNASVKVFDRVNKGHHFSWEFLFDACIIVRPKLIHLPTAFSS